MKDKCLCVNCIKHPSMKGYHKCTQTGQILKKPCYVWEHCKNVKTSLRYKLHMLKMNHLYKRSYKL